MGVACTAVIGCLIHITYTLCAKRVSDLEVASCGIARTSHDFVDSICGGGKPGNTDIRHISRNGSVPPPSKGDHLPTIR